MYTSGMVFLLYSTSSNVSNSFSDYDLRKGNRFGYRFYFEEVYHLRLGQINSSVDYLQNLIEAKYTICMQVYMGVCFCGGWGGTRLLYCLFCMNTNTVET